MLAVYGGVLHPTSILYLMEDVMITVDQIAEIKKKVSILKEKKARAEGAMENIRRRWRDEYQCNSREEVESKIKALDEEIVENEKRINILLEKIDKAYDWGSV